MILITISFSYRSFLHLAYCTCIYYFTCPHLCFHQESESKWLSSLLFARRKNLISLSSFACWNCPLPKTCLAWREPLAVALLMVSKMRTISILNTSAACEMRKRAIWKRNRNQNHSITIWIAICCIFVSPCIEWFVCTNSFWTKEILWRTNWSGTYNFLWKWHPGMMQNLWASWNTCLIDKILHNCIFSYPSFIATNAQNDCFHHVIFCSRW